MLAKQEPEALENGWTAVERAREDKVAHGEIETEHPGYLGAQAQGPRTGPIQGFPAGGSRGVEGVRHRTARRLRPEARPDIVGAPSSAWSQSGPEIW
jgi:hypothetical protein